MPDRVLAGLTLRQLVIVGTDALFIWALIAFLGNRLPVVFLGMVLLPVAAIGMVFALPVSGAKSVDQLALSGLRFLLSPKTRLLAPDGMRHGRQAALEGPSLEVLASGVISHQTDSYSAICRATSLNLALRDEKEQRALVEGFGRFLNSLDGSAQFLIRAEPTDLAGLISAIEDGHVRGSNSGLAELAADHLHFLADLAEDESRLRREVFLCLADSGSATDVSERLQRRIAGAESLLRGIGVRLSRLTAEESRALLGRAIRPSVEFSSMTSLSDEVINGVEP